MDEVSFMFHNYQSMVYSKAKQLGLSGLQRVKDYTSLDFVHNWLMLAFHSHARANILLLLGLPLLPLYWIAYIILFWIMQKMLKYDPAERISAKAAMDHPYFDSLDKSQF